MTTNGGIPNVIQGQFVFFIFAEENPIATFHLFEELLCNILQGCFATLFSSPFPQFYPQIIGYLRICALRADSGIVVSPTSEDWVQGKYYCSGVSLLGAKDFTNAFVKSLHTFLCGLDESNIPGGPLNVRIYMKIKPKEVESLLHTYNISFLVV